MPTSAPSCTTSSLVSPSPISRSPVCSSAARWMIRSRASRLMSSPAISAPRLLLTARRGQRLAGGAGRQGGDGRGGRSPGDGFEESLEQVDRDREDRGRVLFGRDLRHRLEVAQLNGGGLGADDLGGHRQLFRGLELAFGVDDLGAALALGFGLDRKSTRLN